MSKLYGIASIVVVTVAVVGCTNYALTSPIVITNALYCQNLTMRKGQELILTLPSNPSTGYRWDITKQSHLLQQRKIGVYSADKSDPLVVGGGGKITWDFEAVERGKDQLELVYHRPWEKDTKPAKMVSCDFKVK